MIKPKNNKGFATLIIMMMSTFLFFSFTIAINANFSLHNQNIKKIKHLQKQADNLRKSHE